MIIVPRRNATLSPRGVCSRIPRPRHISRDSHGQISTHVFLLHIIPLPPSTRSTRLTSSFRVESDAAAILDRRHQCIENILHSVFHICKPEFMVGEALLQLFKESSVIYAPQKLSLEYPIGPPSETHSLRRFDAISD